MPNKRASLDLDIVATNDGDEIDISSFVNTGNKKKISIHNKDQILKEVKEQGFISREPAPTRRVISRSPFVEQTNFKTRIGLKGLVRELSTRLKIYDQETWDRAFLALLEKEGFDDLVHEYYELIE